MVLPGLLRSAAIGPEPVITQEGYFWGGGHLLRASEKFDNECGKGQLPGWLLNRVLRPEDEGRAR